MTRRSSFAHDPDREDPWDVTERILAEISEVVAKNRRIVEEIHRREADR